MSLFTVDTNILVYAANVDSPFHSPARALLEGWRRSPETWYCGWNTLYEFTRVVTHPKVLHRPWRFAQAWGFCESLLDSPAVRLMSHGPRHADIVAALAKAIPSVSGNLVHDLHTVALMREHEITTIYTRDTGFKLFTGIQAVDPLAPA